MAKKMTVNELIEKLKKFNPDGNALVFDQYEDNDNFDTIDRLSLEEDADGNLIVVIHTV